MNRTNHRSRKLKNFLVQALTCACTLLVIAPLALVFFHLARSGVGSVNLAFFTHMPKPVGEAGGGMANAILGTLVLIGLAALFAVPIGCITGVHLSEYPATRFSSVVRFSADALNGVPSIVI